MVKTRLLSLVGAFVVTAGLASADIIVGGNDAVARAYNDNYSNFSILDRNNAISTTGALTSWSIYTANTGQVELVIYRYDGTNYSIVANSGLVTPTVGLNSFALAPNFNVQAGDYVGLHFAAPSSVVYSYNGPENNAAGANVAEVLYSDNQTGLTAAFVNSTNRTYSVNVSSAVPEPAVWSVFVVGFTGAGMLARSRRNRRNIA